MEAQGAISAHASGWLGHDLGQALADIFVWQAQGHRPSSRLAGSRPDETVLSKDDLTGQGTLGQLGHAANLTRPCSRGTTSQGRAPWASSAMSWDRRSPMSPSNRPATSGGTAPGAAPLP